MLATTALAERRSDADDRATGELALVFAWTRAGADDIEGFAGPRWTNRWGLTLAVRGKLSSSDAPLELEERCEAALWLASVGQTFSWRAPARLTDRIWRDNDYMFSAGGFVDFAGLGPAPSTAARLGERGEVFPIYLGISYDVSTGVAAMSVAQPDRAESALLAPFGPNVVGATTSFEIAYARVVGPHGDLRYINHRLEVRNLRTAQGAQRAASWDFDALSGRDVPLRRGSAWSLSGRIGLSTLAPLEAARDDQLPRASIIPLIAAGISHRASSAWLHPGRSEIGRPLVESTDFGVELATLHRLVELAGIDAGVQATAWVARPIGSRVLVYSEAMAAVARRRDRVESDGSWVSGHGVIPLLRSEIGVQARVLGHADLIARAWIEDSDRDAPNQGTRWTRGIQAGMGWQL